tara:strand:+ start:614 stop:772 length:159 start_codon:yes stop_codon:yes gene_type:complete
MKKANKNKVEKFIGADRADERCAINNFYMGGSSNYSNSEYTNLILTILEFSI